MLKKTALFLKDGFPKTVMTTRAPAVLKKTDRVPGFRQTLPTIFRVDNHYSDIKSKLIMSWPLTTHFPIRINFHDITSQCNCARINRN